jgi:predicted AlkP superfamily pyrophosphatase or phosphodiesterase
MNYSPGSGSGATIASPIAKRVVLAIIGGLRPDAIEEFSLSNIQTIADLGASTLTCKSVSPAYATTCVGSIMTGVSPSEHGMRTDRLSFPRNLGYLETLPRLIANEGYQVSAFMGEIPSTIRGTAGLVGRELGFPSLSFAGNTSAEVLRSALHNLCSQRRGLIALYFSDADRAGHEHGWMSHEYGVAARRIDQSIGILNALSAPGSGESMLVVTADHGGGGENPNGHVSDHPLDLTVPLVLAGRHIARCTLGDVSLIDIPPTILRALGMTVPRSYEGRVLTETFDNIKSRATVFA